MTTKLLTLILVSGFIISCQKNDSNSPAPAVVAPHNYGYNNGVCYDYTANVNVDRSLCLNQQPYNNPNNGYYWNGTTCVSSTTGQPVAIAQNLCNGGINNNQFNYNGYFSNPHWLNGMCVNAAGQQIDLLYCSNQSNTYTTPCNGWYYKVSYHDSSFWGNYYTYVSVNCWANSCSGQTLVDSMQRQVICQ